MAANAVYFQPYGSPRGYMALDGNAAHRQTLSDLEGRLRAIEEEREQLVAGITALRRLMEGTVSTIRAISPSGKVSTATVRRIGVPLTELAERVIEAAGHPLKADKIKEAIESQYGRKVIRTSLVSALDRKVNAKEMFTKPAPGTYGLLQERGR
jgi:hypothetical protein